MWFVQAYDPNDGNCKSFATGWEDVAHSYAEHAKFGRLDVTKAELKVRRKGLVPQPSDLE